MRAGLLLALLAGPAAAQEAPGGLEGREVTFGSLLYEVPEAPLFLGQRHPSVVADGPEYGLGPEGPQNGWDIIPAVVDISDDRVEITYPEGVSGRFPEIGFNGYVLDFLIDCVLFRSASVGEGNTGGIAGEDIFVEGAKLYIDVGGAVYGPDVTFAVALDVIDCPIG